MYKVISKFISKVFFLIGYEVSRIPGRSKNQNDEFFQMKHFLAGKSDLTIFDVGAHSGKLSKIYRHIFPESQIFAFEPLPDCFEVLSKFSDEDDKIQALNIAISSKSESREFHITANQSTSSLLKSSKQGRKHWGENILKTVGKIQVECTSLDAFCSQNNINVIHLLKLDIQGSELDALKGAKNLFDQRQIILIYIEISILNSYNNQGSFHEIISFLKKYDFELFNIYKATRKEGRLLEVDGMFVRKDILAKFNH